MDFSMWSWRATTAMNAWIAERTNARMDHAKSQKKPFFLWASFFDPHPPYLIPEPWGTMYDPSKSRFLEKPPPSAQRKF
jgi:arylsulfatase A-like enzyme